MAQAAALAAGHHAGAGADQADVSRGRRLDLEGDRLARGQAAAHHCPRLALHAGKTKALAGMNHVVADPAAAGSQGLVDKGAVAPELMREWLSRQDMRVHGPETVIIRQKGSADGADVEDQGMGVRAADGNSGLPLE